MPYTEGERLPGERSSKLGHLDVLKSPLVQELCRNFEDPSKPASKKSITWQTLPSTGKPLSLIFAVDGSYQVIESEGRPKKALGFIKTALVMLDQPSLASIDKEEPHPFAIRDILEKSQIYHATVFPLRHIEIGGQIVYHAVRRIIYDSMKDPSLEGEVMETLKWIAYQKWEGFDRNLPPFECPHCDSTNCSLPYDSEIGTCPDCSKEIFLTDMLGFHLEMADDAAPDSIAASYMSIHETLLLFTGIRYFWQNKKEVLPACLFIKDGPLSIRAQYSKLVEPIRRFLSMARDSGTSICVLGQEKSGAFADHLKLIADDAPLGSFFVPGHNYIREEVQHRPIAGAGYGKDTNYGAKVFVRFNERNRCVLNIPTGMYVRDPIPSDLIGASDIFATLPTVLSAKYEDALLPVELAHSVASLSTYPSAKVLAMFAEAARRKD
ncbi:MAG: hypothetical protein ABFD82_11130 [Syntrophaceae bacterium]